MSSTLNYNFLDKETKLKWKMKALSFAITMAFIDNAVSTFLYFDQCIQYIFRFSLFLIFALTIRYLIAKAEAVANILIFFSFNILVFLLFYNQEDISYFYSNMQFSLPIFTFILTCSEIYFIASAIILQIQMQLFLPLVQQKGHLLQSNDFLTQIRLLQFATTILPIYFFLLLIKQTIISQTQAVEQQQRAEDYASKLNSFIQSFSHELRNPLNTLQGSLTLAQQDQKNPQILESHLSNSMMCTTIILQFVNNILDAGKNDIDKLEIANEPVNLKETLYNLWSIFIPMLKSKKLYGSLHLSLDIPETLYLDKTRITQVIMNLFSNAQKFTKEGQVKLKFSWIKDGKVTSEEDFKPEKQFQHDQSDFIEQDIESTKLDEEFRNEMMNDSILKRSHSKRELKYNILSTFNKAFQYKQNFYHKYTAGILKISVQDTGDGISPENLPKLFQKFSQVSKSKSDSQKGTGLGLNITNEIIKQCGGDIKVFSKEGRGTEFIACIPTYYDPVFEIENFKKLATFKITKQKKLKYLLFNDIDYENKMIQNLMESLDGQLLSKTRYCQQAIAIYKNIIKEEQNVDLIFIKSRGVIHSGIEIFKQIRKIEHKQLKPNQSSCQVIFLGNIKSEELPQNVNIKQISQPIYYQALFNAIYSQIQP